MLNVTCFYPLKPSRPLGHPPDLQNEVIESIYGLLKLTPKRSLQ